MKNFNNQPMNKGKEDLQKIGNFFRGRAVNKTKKLIHSENNKKEYFSADYHGRKSLYEESNIQTNHKKSTANKEYSSLVTISSEELNNASNFNSGVNIKKPFTQEESKRTIIETVRRPKKSVKLHRKNKQFLRNIQGGNGSLAVYNDDNLSIFSPGGIFLKPSAVSIPSIQRESTVGNNQFAEPAKVPATKKTIENSNKSISDFSIGNSKIQITITPLTTTKLWIGLGLLILGSIGLHFFTSLTPIDVFFWLFLFSMFYFDLNSRISIGAALIFLVIIMLFTFIDSLHITTYWFQDKLETLAVWVYYFLVIGVFKQIWEYRQEIKRNMNNNPRKTDNQHGLTINTFEKKALQITMILATILSIGSFLFFYFHGQWNLIYCDTYPHLNMARKVFDNITPGIGQLGGQWLPLFHILMLPFIWNEFLWHSGIAGALVSMPAFILSVYFIFKLIELLFNDRRSAFIGALVYMTSINMLYLQSMAMMESLFNLTIIGSVYFISRWAVNQNIFDLVLAGIFVSMSTLTRYEGYSVWGMSLLAVALIVHFKKRHSFVRNITGTSLFFVVISSLGIIFWMIYLGVVFHNPLHWLHPLRDTVTIASDIEQTTKPVLDGFQKAITEGIKNNNPAPLTKSLLSAAFYTNGAITFLMAIIGFGLVVFYFVKNIKKLYYFSAILLIPVASLLFLTFLVLLDKVSIFGPSIFSLSIFNKWSNYAAENGMRYTLSLLPFTAIFTAILTLGNLKRQLFVIFLILMQFFFVFIGPVFVTYNFAIKWKQVYSVNSSSVEFIKNNYDSGLILLSSLIHEEDMFKYKLPYKSYLTESAYKIWDESLRDPSKYATWIIMNNDLKGRAMGGSDVLTRLFIKHPERFKNFEIVYKDDSIKIFRNKYKPKINLLKKLGKE